MKGKSVNIFMRSFAILSIIATLMLGLIVAVMSILPDRLVPKVGALGSKETRNCRHVRPDGTSWSHPVCKPPHGNCYTVPSC